MEPPILKVEAPRMIKVNHVKLCAVLFQNNEECMQVYIKSLQDTEQPELVFEGAQQCKALELFAMVGTALRHHLTSDVSCCCVPRPRLRGNMP